MSLALLRGAWVWRLVFLAAVLLLVFLRLLPLPYEAGAWPGPDLVLALTCAWVLRRPEHLPALMIALVIFAEDLLLMRPPGLWAAILLMGTEVLRSRAAFAHELTFLAEWVTTSVLMAAMMLGFRAILALVALPQPGLTLTLVQLVYTILAYPVIVGALSALGVLRKRSAAEREGKGMRA